jgi:hypothetical protein
MRCVVVRLQECRGGEDKTVGVKRLMRCLEEVLSLDTPKQEARMGCGCR